jgi:hypothetical protein
MIHNRTVAAVLACLALTCPGLIGPSPCRHRNPRGGIPFKVHTNLVLSVAFSLGGKTLVSASNDHMVRLGRVVLSSR